MNLQWTDPQDATGKDRWMWTQKHEDECEEPTVSPVIGRTDTTRQEAEGDRDDKRRRIDEPESTVPTAAQDEVLAPCLVTFDSDTRDDEVVVDGPIA